MSSHLGHLQATRLPLVAVLAVLCAHAGAVENDVRLVPQLLVGTAGVEPGIALEIRPPANPLFIVRPELLISEDGRLGAGGAILFDLTPSTDLPGRQAVAVGPRVVYHNADDVGWEADAMVTWSYALSHDTRPWRHAVGALAALGLARDTDHHDTDIGATVGAFYAFGF